MTSHFTLVEIIDKGPNNKAAVLKHGLLLLLLSHLGGHHGLHGGGLGSEDDAMTGEPLTLLTDDGPVSKDSVLDTELLNSSSRFSGSRRLVT